MTNFVCDGSGLLGPPTRLSWAMVDMYVWKGSVMKLVTMEVFVPLQLIVTRLRQHHCLAAVSVYRLGWSLHLSRSVNQSERLPRSVVYHCISFINSMSALRVLRPSIITPTRAVKAIARRHASSKLIASGEVSAD
jgi:hypothetical protein